MGISTLKRFLLGTALWLIGLTACAISPVKNDASPVAKTVSQDGTTLQNEQLIAEAPGGWVQSGGTVTDTLKMATFIPKPSTAGAEVNSTTTSEEGEASAADGGWTEKITFERLLGTPVADPLEYLDELKKDTLAACKEGAFLPVASGFENGYPSAVAFIVCPRQAITNSGQLTMIKVIQGNAAFYTITRSIRTAPFPPDENGKPGEPPVEKETIGGFSVYLKAISVCDPTRPAHPCPQTPISN
jgi:hypothetical protein